MADVNLVPGLGLVQEIGTDETLLPGLGILNETVTGEQPATSVKDIIMCGIIPFPR